MPRAFLSHSSDDKHYVRVVADRLGTQRCIFDERSFEAGLPTLEEIERSLTESDIFVFFVSDTALESEWVKRELASAREKLGTGVISRLYPILIDPGITYLDPRLPPWLREDYNLKLVSRPTIAARRVEQQLRRLSWEFHPRLRERQKIFVGRNESTRSFEERVDSLDAPAVNCVIASGLPGIGRRTLLRHCLSKANLVTDGYEPAVLLLSDGESIEDFILRIYDLGFSADVNVSGLLARAMPDKVSLGVRLLRDAWIAHEVLLVIDNGAIVLPEATLAEWFQGVAAGMSDIDRPVLAIASRYRIRKQELRNYAQIYAMEVSELSAPERNGLLKRYAEWSGMSLSVEDLRFLAGLLTGLPEQVLYAVDVVRDEGLPKVFRESYRIVDFGRQRISVVLATLEEDAGALEFMRLLAEFEFVGQPLLLDIMRDAASAGKYLDRFVAMAICEFVGSAGEYIRLNEAVRDYALRNLELTAEQKGNLREHLKRSLGSIDSEDMDAADVLATLKMALLRGDELPNTLLVPSHFLKAVKDLYDSRQSNAAVIALAERALLSKSSMDPRIARELRVYLCLALARARDGRFFSEMHEFRNLPHAEYEFLHGFYYRQTGDLVRAVQSFTSALAARPSLRRASNELARIYLQLEAFKLARPLAEDAHNASPDNTHYLRTYFEALVRFPPTEEMRTRLTALLTRLARIRVHMAGEMYLNAQAQFAAYYDRDWPGARRLLDEASRQAREPTHHLFTLCEIAKNLRDQNAMRDILKALHSQSVARESHAVRLARLDILFAALSGNATTVTGTMASVLSRLPAEVHENVSLEIADLTHGRELH